MNPTQRHDEGHRSAAAGLPPTMLLLIDEEDGDVSVAVEYSIVDARPVIRTVNITVPPGGEITAPLLRTIANRVHKVTERGLANLLASKIGLPEDALEDGYEQRRRRRTWTHSELVRVAEAWRAGGPRKRRAAVEAEFGVSGATAARAIAKARSAGLIPTTEEDN